MCGWSGGILGKLADVVWRAIGKHPSNTELEVELDGLRALPCGEQQIGSAALYGKRDASWGETMSTRNCTVEAVLSGGMG